MTEKNRKLLIVLENIRELKKLMKNNPDPEIREIIADTEKLVRELLG